MNAAVVISCLTFSLLLPHNNSYSIYRRPISSWIFPQQAEPDTNALSPAKHRRQIPFSQVPPPGFQDSSGNSQNSRGFSWGDPERNDDFYVFDAFVEEPTTPSTTTIAVPGMETTQSPCEEVCRTTYQYNPVCGSNGRTFYNPARLRCAQKCGQKIFLNHIGACS